MGARGSPAPLVQVIWFLPEPIGLLVQVGFSAFAWGTLAIAFCERASSEKLRLIQVTFILLLSWLPLVVVHDLSILTESISLSGAVLLVAAAHSYVVPSRSSYLRGQALLLMTVGLFSSCLARPINFILLAPIFLAAIALRKVNGRRKWSLGLGFALVALALFASFVSFTGRDSEIEYFRSVNRLAWRSSPNYLAAAEQQGLVFCDQNSRLQVIENYEASYQQLGFGPLRFRVMGGERQQSSEYARDYIASLECPSVQSWLRSDRSSFLAMFLASPKENIRQWWTDFPSQNFSDSGRFSPLVNRIESLVIPLTTVFVAVALGTKALKARQDTRRLWSKDSRRRRRWLLGATLLAVVSFSLITWAADQMEVARHFLPAPLVLLASLLLNLSAQLQISGPESRECE